MANEHSQSEVHSAVEDSQSTFSCFPSIPPPLKLKLVELPEHTCPYLPNRMAKNRAFWAEKIPGGVHRQFMDAAFRRSGHIVYQPICVGCRQCVPIRVPVDRFTPTKSQRRCFRKNADLQVEIGRPEVTDEKFQLYQRYTSQWHGAELKESRENFEAFLYQSPVDTAEFVYRSPAGELLAVGICDLEPDSLSSVYFYFDPNQAVRGLGTYSALYELDFAKKHLQEHYYLGYWVAACETMRYKANFRPYELLGTDGVWREVPLEPR